MPTNPSHSYIHNALLRCTRADSLASPIFELVQDDLNLWVLELTLGETPQLSLEAEITALYQRLRPHSDQLQKLRSGSSDYTLHITYCGDESARIILPIELLQLASQCQFQIEVYRWDLDNES